jgi:hypothetical protein
MSNRDCVMCQVATFSVFDLFGVDSEEFGSTIQRVQSRNPKRRSILLIDGW